MPVNKVVYGNTTVIDLTQSTLSDAASLMAGVTAFDRAGNLITGTAQVSEWTSGIYKNQNGVIRVSPNTAAGGVKLVDGYLRFAPDAHGFDPNLGTKTITANGTYTASSESLDGYSSVVVSVSGGGSLPVLQNKTATPTTSTQTITADSGYDGLDTVTVNPIPSNYITTADATAVAADIVSPKTAYVDGVKVNGSLIIQHYYTGSSAPSSSLGVNGDIYLQT